MHQVAVISLVYNTLPLVRRSLEAALSLASPALRLYLVDNHSPDQTAREYAHKLAEIDPRVMTVDPGSNLGVHGGWNFAYAGAQHDARHPTKPDFWGKLDDDVVLQTRDWDQLLAESLVAWPELAFVAADAAPHQRQNNPYMKEKRGAFSYDALHWEGLDPARPYIVQFLCAMFRAADIARWVPLRGRGLYGGEEHYCAFQARKEGRPIAHLREVFVEHLGNEDRHPDFNMWK